MLYLRMLLNCLSDAVRWGGGLMLFLPGIQEKKRSWLQDFPIFVFESEKRTIFCEILTYILLFPGIQDWPPPCPSPQLVLEYGKVLSVCLILIQGSGIQDLLIQKSNLAFISSLCFSALIFFRSKILPYNTRLSTLNLQGV